MTYCGHHILNECPRGYEKCCCECYIKKCRCKFADGDCEYKVEIYESRKTNIKINNYKDIEKIKEFITTVFEYYGELKISFVLESVEGGEVE